MNLAEQPLVSVCGCPGYLSVIGTDTADAESCLVWRTDAQLLKRSGLPVEHGSLLGLACDLAEFYHHKGKLHLADQHGEVEVIWLELAADGALLVLLKPPLASLSPASVPGQA